MSTTTTTTTIPTQCLAAQDESGKMMRHVFHRRAVGPSDVHIKITYSGICHSDIHTAKGEWGKKSYPLCVGHEILGRVVAVGDKVTKFEVGDLAGVGCFTDSCRDCDECHEGDEQYCSGPGGMHGTYGSERPEELHPGGVSQGGYSSDIVVDENYTIRVPEKMDVAAAAPLLCAGITCFSPFKNFGVKPGMTVGVAGLGGLGHMAVKIAKAMGATVVGLTRSKAKVASALSMGCDEVVISTDPDAMLKARRTMHMMYDSIAAPHSIPDYLALLRNKGTLIVVGGVPEDIAGLKAGMLLARGLSIQGSCIGGIRQTQEMIDFCAAHDILADIELIEATPEAVDTAWDRTLRSDVKYRFVIDTAATLGKGFCQHDDEHAGKDAEKEEDEGKGSCPCSASSTDDESKA